MKKLLLLVGLVFFLTPMVVSAETVFKSELPKCKIIKNEIKSIRSCYGKIVYSGGNIYEGEFKFDKSKKRGGEQIGFVYHGIGKFTYIDGNFQKGKWENGIFISGESTKTAIAKKDGYNYCKKNNGKVYSSSFDCTNAIKITEKEFKTLIKKIWIHYCEKSNGEVYTSKACNNNKEINKTRYDKLKKKYPVEFRNFARALGCGSKVKNIDDCVRRYLPSVAGTGPMTLEQVNEISKDKELMGEIVHSIAEMNRQQNQSQSEPSEKEKQQALAQQNSGGQATWKSTAGGIWYWDYGNGFGWAPPNPIRDKIIQGLMVSQRTKNMLKTGSRGRTIFIPR